MAQSKSLTGRAIQWIGPPQQSWVVPTYWQEILQLSPAERRQPRDDERPVLATGTHGTVGELVHSDPGGHVYALYFPVGPHTYELETVLPPDEPHPLVRFLDDDLP
jgi:hypothetical protein